jgi:hypothetical protein
LVIKGKIGIYQCKNCDFNSLIFPEVEYKNKGKIKNLKKIKNKILSFS